MANNKGADWERSTCKYLSKWCQGTEKPLLLWRGHGSGAMFTKDNLVGESFAGDIYSVREEGKIITDYVSIECKNGYPKTTLDNHLKYNKKDPIKDFWIQTVNDATKTNKYPMLVFKKKSFKPWMATNKEFFNIFIDKLDDIRYIIIHYNELPDMYLLSFEEFFERIDIEIWKSRLCID